MKMLVSKEWCIRMAEEEGDVEIGAGSIEIVLKNMIWNAIKEECGSDKAAWIIAEKAAAAIA